MNCNSVQIFCFNLERHVPKIFYCTCLTARVVGMKGNFIAQNSSPLVQVTFNQGCYNRLYNWQSNRINSGKASKSQNNWNRFTIVWTVQAVFSLFMCIFLGPNYRGVEYKMEYNHSVSNLAWEKWRRIPHVPDLAIALRVTARFARQGYGLGRLSAKAVR